MALSAVSGKANRLPRLFFGVMPEKGSANDRLQDS